MQLISIRKLLLSAATITMTGSMPAQYIPSDQGSSVTFKIKNFGFDVSGKFTGVHGAINFDSQNPAAGSFDVSIDATSVNTDNSLRDSHLKGEGYFNTNMYPSIHFVSTGIQAGGQKGMLLLTGNLTIKDIVREIKFPFVADLLGDDYVFRGSFKIKRKDFQIGGASTIGDELEVSLNVRARKT